MSPNYPIWRCLATTAFVCWFVGFTKAQAPCGAMSHCIPIRGCAELYRLLHRPTRARLTRLKNLRCGSENGKSKVCCPITREEIRNPFINSQPGIPNPLPAPTPTRSLPNENPRTTPSPVRSIPSSPSEALLEPNCGISPVHDKVLGGTPAPLGAYPWMAVLGYEGLGGSIHWGCGATLINRRYVLTAAHCTDLNVTLDELKLVRLGENDLSQDLDCEGRKCAPRPQDFTIQSVTSHPSYLTRGYNSDDVSLIRLNRDVEMSVFIIPICLPPPTATPGDVMSLLWAATNYTVVVTGWGDTETGRRSQRLLQVTLPFVPMAECRAAGSYRSTLIAGAGQVCFGGQFQMDSCFKDSGGPAMVTRHSTGPPYVQIGIVSYGATRCGLEGVPGIYSDVTYYRQWIVNSLKP